MTPPAADRTAAIARNQDYRVSPLVRVPALVALLAVLPRIAGQGTPLPRQSASWRTLTGESREATAADARVAQLAAEHHLGAISVAVVQDARLAYAAVAGEFAPGHPADTLTVFRGASLGKPVFAYLVLRLVDEGVLGLDDPVATLLKRPLREYDHYRALADDPRHVALTVRRILSQQSGLPNWHRSGPVSLLAEPGTQFGYSGEGYALLQFAVEERTGRTVNDLAREKVFAPLGMFNTSYLWDRRFDGRFAVDLNTELRPLLEKSRERANAAGSIITNAADYARFLVAVMEGRGLRETTRVAMTTPQVRITSRSLFSAPGTDTGDAKRLGLAWTVGWGRMETARDGWALFHVGREEGCEAYAVVFPERRTGFVVLSLSPVTSTFSAPLVEALIGGGSEPLAWLEYGRAAGGPLRRGLALLAALIVLAAAVVLTAVGSTSGTAALRRSIGWPRQEDGDAITRSTAWTRMWPWFLGVVLSAAGMFLGYDIGSETARLLGGEPGLWARMGKGFAWGGLIAALQWPLVRAAGVAPLRFVLAGAVGLAVGYPLGQTIQGMLVEQWSAPWMGYAAALAAFGLSLSVPQWWVIRRQFLHAKMWIGFSVAGWLLSGILVTGARIDVLDSVVYGMLAGLGLVWIAQSPRPRDT